jgi:hypothetical protein
MRQWWKQQQGREFIDSHIALVDEVVQAQEAQAVEPIRRRL